MQRAVDVEGRAGNCGGRVAGVGEHWALLGGGRVKRGQKELGGDDSPRTGSHAFVPGAFGQPCEQTPAVVKQSPQAALLNQKAGAGGRLRRSTGPAGTCAENGREAAGTLAFAVGEEGGRPCRDVFLSSAAQRRNDGLGQGAGGRRTAWTVWAAREWSCASRPRVSHKLERPMTPLAVYEAEATRRRCRPAPQSAPLRGSAEAAAPHPARGRWFGRR
ncbi:hypothetical protein BDV95DRAFT_593467 [Massariosphaeria phaeospora]|uniref:Uncharacterized protein n=1 Tax=Massariosphaeria phaeospora TaxID=100035 RepID=A0A7C8I863_9PLEO|nr:hypothetical protein BDV95DRAFT_593467 [Massariosphaeria phaeospora]